MSRYDQLYDAPIKDLKPDGIYLCTLEKSELRDSKKFAYVDEQGVEQCGKKWYFQFRIFELQGNPGRYQNAVLFATYELEHKGAMSALKKLLIDVFKYEGNFSGAIRHVEQYIGCECKVETFTKPDSDFQTSTLIEINGGAPF